MQSLSLSQVSIAIIGRSPETAPVALVSPTTGAVWVTPDGKMLVIMEPKANA